MGQFVHKFGNSDTELRGTRQYCLSAYFMSSPVPNSLHGLLPIIYHLYLKLY